MAGNIQKQLLRRLHSCSRQLHPRNIYQGNPDIRDLALRYPEFRLFGEQDLSGKIKVNYKDKNAVSTLSRCLLKRDFDLNVELPPERLIPALPLRLNYILWIEDLLEKIPQECKSNSENINGIDIGTGAVCIYALLAAKKNKWKMLATELDEISFKSAKHNVDLNNLNDYIEVKKVDADTYISGVLDADVTYDFSMCNPPFYSHASQLTKSGKKDRTGHRVPPKGICTGSPVELVTEGGEVEFIRKMINDSVNLKNNVKIYTSMIGCRKSLDVLFPEVVKLVGDKNVAVTCFNQGNVTRWGIAWTFYDNIKLADKIEVIKKPKRPMMYERSNITLESAVERVKFLLDRIQINRKLIINTKTEYSMELTSYKATWAHQRKRRRMEKEILKKKMKSENDGDNKTVEISQDVEDSDNKSKDGENNSVTPENSQESKPIVNSEDKTKENEPVDNDVLSSTCSVSKTNDSSTPILSAIILLKSDNNNNVAIHLSTLIQSDQLGLQSIAELMQYLKNHWDRDLLM